MADGCKYREAQASTSPRVKSGHVMASHRADSASIAVNHVRALRLAEVMEDFRNLQRCLSQIEATPTADEYNWPAFVLLRQCSSEGLAVLQAPFVPTNSSPDGDVEREKDHLAR